MPAIHPLGAPVGLGVLRQATHRAMDYVALASEALVMLALAADLAVTLANSVARYGFKAGIGWSEDDPP